MSQQSEDTTFAILRPVNLFAKQAMSDVVENIESKRTLKDDNPSANSSSYRIKYQGEKSSFDILNVL